MAELYIVVGAGVIGLTNALELIDRYPSSKIIVVAKHTPGDSSIEYCSPWAGANWLSAATDNGRQEKWDAIAYRRFMQLAETTAEAGVTKMDITAFFNSDLEEAGIVSEKTGKIWYEELVGGLKYVEKDELKDGAKFGFSCPTVIIDTGIYLGWLQSQVLKRAVEIRRAIYSDIREVFTEFPTAAAIFNCTGLGSYHLTGVEDKKLYPSKGQVMLVESPKVPITQMFMQSPQRVNADTTYVFPRGKYGGVILGGCRVDNDWNGEVDLKFAEDIKQRCCRLCPGLGKPEDLKIIKHGVGLRPARKGGARLEREVIDGKIVVHNYGASGTGYQASWGMAKTAVDLLDNGEII